MTAIRWGQAKREVIANWPLISQKFCETTIRQIWLELKASGRVTCSQSNFYAQVKAHLTPEQPSSSPSTGRDLVALAASPLPVTVTVNRQNVAYPTSPVEAGPTATFAHNARADLDEQW
ncbi:hypothetical protein [Magnetospirillum gryphiswaldense]|uniref:hypothetical protein n=1 Tax=Magnetospirillum gryphiswaldense TaxID=55518 RepID=UPI00131A2B37|nr:hypothetical protein [Magnetospirillum gryphiswaldense]